MPCPSTITERADQVEQPRVWVLLGRKPGDNGQVLALAEALGWPCEAKRMAYRSTELITNRLLGVTLAGIDAARSSELAPPWPDLVISAGRRNEPVARWIRARAGGPSKVKLVHVGRPWAPLHLFDLIVTTPQYHLPQRPNILHNEAPMHRVDAERLAAETARWAPRVAALPRPYTAVLMGGHVGPYSLDREAAQELGREASRIARDEGGSLLVSTSARTSKAAIAGLSGALSVPHQLYEWRPDDPENPYLGYLGQADRIVVTSDSMSMLIDAIAAGRPVLIFDLARAGKGRWRMRPGALLWRLGRLLGPRRLARDIGIIHRQQVAAGRAAWLGGDGQPSPRVPPLDDTARAAARVRALFGAVSPGPGMA